MDTQITKQYGNRVRVRVCGLCWKNDQLLMVNHRDIAPGGFWAPPGGGLEFGEPVSLRLEQEFREETGLEVETGRFLFGCEFIKDPLHAIELYFDVTAKGGKLTKGDDPEWPMIEAVSFMTPAAIGNIPAPSLHGIFSLVDTPGDLKSLSGFFRI